MLKKYSGQNNEKHIDPDNKKNLGSIFISSKYDIVAKIDNIPMHRIVAAIDEIKIPLVILQLKLQ